MKDKVLTDLFTHWETLRRGRKAPKRSELDPREMRDILHHTFILECRKDFDFRYRLAGSEICDILGMELRAMPARAIIDPVDRGKFDAALKQMVTEGSILEMRTRFGKGDEARLLFLPMADEGGQITRVLGAIVGRPEGRAAPMRMSILDCVFKRVITGEPLDARSALSGFAEAQTPFQPKEEAPQSALERPYLKLVRKSDE